MGDDTGTCAGCEEAGTWGDAPAGIAVGDQLCASGHCALVTVAAVGKPSPGSSRFTLSGTLALETGKARQRGTVQLPLQDDAELRLGATTYGVSMTEDEHGWKGAHLTTNGMVNLHSIHRALVQGQDVEFELQSVWAEQDDDGQRRSGFDVALQTSAAAVSLEIEFVPVLEITKVPIDFTFSPAGIQAGPTEPGAWEASED